MNDITNLQWASSTATQLTKHNVDYASGNLKVSYGVYLKEYKRLVAKLRKERRDANPYSLVNRMKSFGAKVTKSKEFRGVYIYNGVNFNVEVYMDACETEYWTTDWSIIDNKVLSKLLQDTHSFERKSDVMDYLLSLDHDFNNYKMIDGEATYVA